MKKKFIIGMAVVLSGMTFNAQAAGLKEVKPVREALKGYVEEVRKHTADAIVRANKNNPSTKIKIKTADVVLKQLEVSADKVTAIKEYVAKDPKGANDTLINIRAAKEMAKGKTAPEALSINKAADAYLELLSNANLVGQTRPKSLSVEEFQALGEGVKTLIGMKEKFITFEAKERDSFSEVTEGVNKLVNEGKTIEEALLETVMRVKTLDRTAALDLIRKMKELCL